MDYIITIWPRPFKRYVIKDVASEEEAWAAFNQDDFDDISTLLEEGEGRDVPGHHNYQTTMGYYADIQDDVAKNLARGYGVPVERDDD